MYEQDQEHVLYFHDLDSEPLFTFLMYNALLPSVRSCLQNLHHTILWITGTIEKGIFWISHGRMSGIYLNRMKPLSFQDPVSLCPPWKGCSCVLSRAGWELLPRVSVPYLLAELVLPVADHQSIACEVCIAMGHAASQNTGDWKQAGTTPEEREKENSFVREL